MLYLIIIILLFGWLLGWFVFNAGAFIHLLLIVAVIVLIAKLIRGDKIL